jgi:hypothetical protein
MKKIISFYFVILFINLPLFCKDAWTSYKEETLSEMAKIEGWCSREKANLLMDLIKKNKPKCLVEIGVFLGKSLFPILKAVEHNGQGVVHAIDSWDKTQAIQGFSPSDPNYLFWENQPFTEFYKKTLHLIRKYKLGSFCKVIKNSSIKASSLFPDKSIDFIHFDGNHNKECSFKDIVTYFAKVKDGGYILLNDANWYSMTKSLVFLLERCELSSSFSSSESFVVFRKDKERVKNAETLFLSEKSR